MADPFVDEVLDLIGSDRHLARLVTVLVQLNDKQRKTLSGPVGKRAETVWFGARARTGTFAGCVESLQLWS